MTDWIRTIREFGVKGTIIVLLLGGTVWLLAHVTAAPGSDVSVLWGMVSYRKQGPARQSNEVDSTARDALDNVSKSAMLALNDLATAESWTAALTKQLATDRQQILANLEGLPVKLALQRLRERLSERIAQQRKSYQDWHSALLERRATFAQAGNRLERAVSVEERTKATADVSLQATALLAMELGDRKIHLHWMILDNLLQDVDTMSRHGRSMADILRHVESVLVSEHKVE